MKKVLYTLILFVFLSELHAQSKQEDFPTFKLSSEYLAEGRDKYAEDDYVGALEAFSQINENDTNYSISVSAQVSCLLELDRLDKAEALTREALEKDYPDKQYHYINLGAILSKKEKYDEALQVLDEGLAILPYNTELLYNKVILLEKKKDYEKSTELLRKCIKQLYGISKFHMKAGYTCLEEKEITKAMLALGFYFIKEPGEQNTNAFLAILDKAVSGKLDEGGLESNGIKISTKGDDYAEIDLLIRNYVALDKKYKCPVKTDVPIIKQYHLMMSRLVEMDDTEGFFNEMYVPIYKKIMEEDKFEAFAYTLLASSQSEEHLELVMKHKEEVFEFIAWYSRQIEEQSFNQKINVQGKEVIATVLFNNGKVSAIGKVNDKKMIEGDFWIIHDNGAIGSYGQFDRAGEKTGLWTWYYENGDLKEKSSYQNGKLTGKSTLYHKGDVLHIESNYVDGKADGLIKYYDENGILYREQIYKDGEETGPVTFFHTIGGKKITANFVEGVLEDEFVEYYANGQIMEKGSFKEGNRTGEYLFYYSDGTLKKKSNYNEEGMLNGPFEEYFPNGQLYRKGTFHEGAEIGDWKFYYINGKLLKKLNFDESGKITGTMEYYDIDGKLIEKNEYKKGDLIAYSFHNKEGGIIHEGKKRGKDIQYVEFDPYGVKIQEGEYVDEKKEGKWESYFESGQLKEIKHYKEGVENGPYYQYFENGNLKKQFKFEEGKANSKFTSNYEGERPYEIGWYMDDLRAGDWTEYYPDGTIENKSYYINDVLTGYTYAYDITGKIQYRSRNENGVKTEVVSYDTLGNVVKNDIISPQGVDTLSYYLTNGIKWLDQAYFNGVVHGNSAWYFPNGKISAKGAFYNSKRHGDWEWYFPNGQLLQKGAYKNGERDGDWVIYYEEGTVHKKISYLNGNLHGKFEYFHENGKLQRVDNYFNGSMYDKTYFYGQGGEMEHIRFYHNDKILGYSYLDKDGSEKPMIRLPNSTGKVETFYKNGNPSRIYELKKGSFDGDYKTFYYSGKLEYSSRYEDDILQGNRVYYYENGKVKEECNYVNGFKNGVSKEYYPSGKLKRSVKYVHGNKHGKEVIRDENGNVIKTYVYYSDEIIDMQ